MNIKKFENLEDAGRFLAGNVVIAAEKAITERGFFTLVLSGGRSPQPFMRLLASSEFHRRIEWRNVLIFFGDERAVPQDSEQSNYKSAYDAFLSKVSSLPKGNIFRMKGEQGASAAAADYEQVLHNFAVLHNGFLKGAFPRFDFVLLGLGPDGHTASLFPGTDALEENDKWAVPAPAPPLKPRVERITLTFPVLNNASKIVLLTTREGKANIIDAIMENRQAAEPVYPAARAVPTNGELIWCISDR